MRNNEKGFTYPLSLCILTFFALFFLIGLDQYVAEKRFYKETETILVGEYYMLAAVKETENLLMNGQLPTSGRFIYTNGEITYQRKVLSAVLDEVTFTLKFSSMEQWSALAHYDKVQKKWVKWVEKN